MMIQFWTCGANAPGHDLFQASSRTSDAAGGAVRDCRPQSEPTPPPALHAARSACASSPVLPPRSDAAQ
jgi:hypothetical protein